MPKGEIRQYVNGFIAMSGSRWAWGVDMAEARARLKRSGKYSAADMKEFPVLELPEGAVNAYVDGLGYVRWDWTDDAPDRLATTTYAFKPKGWE